MSQFLEFKPNDAQSDVREIITTNFKNATLKPENKTENTKLFSLVGISAEGEQQLYNAKDGLDYLSPETGISKDGADQIINGKLATKELEVSPNGALITDHLFVYNRDNEGDPSFTIENNKKLTSYGESSFKENSTFEKKVTVGGGIISSENKNNLGDSDFSNINVTSAGTLVFLKATNATLNSLLVNTTLEVNGAATLNSTLHVKGRTTFDSRVDVAAPGNLGVTLVRPMYVGTTEPVSLASGTLYGQYEG